MSIVKAECRICGDEFIYESNSGVNKKQYCSPDCQKEAQDQIRYEFIGYKAVDKGHEIEIIKVPMPRICAKCGETFTPESLRSVMAKFCSGNCSQASKREMSRLRRAKIAINSQYGKQATRR